MTLRQILASLGWLGVALGVLAFEASAQPQRPAGAAERTQQRATPTAQSVQQKMDMVDRMLLQSPVAGRIVAARDEQAQRHLSAARELLAHSRVLAAGGLLRGADALLNESIWEFGRAQQLVPDPATQMASDRARYSQLEDSVSALLRAAVIAAPQGAPQAPAQRAQALADEAAAQARAGRHPEANQRLAQALVILLQEASSRLTGQTLVYDRRFADRREEFSHEVEQFRSYERLVPIALLEFRPGAQARAQVDRHLADARSSRLAGESLATSDLAAAIRQVSEGTESLRRALQAAGLVVPQTMDSR